MNTRYIEVDSTYRNRNEYPNPAQFVVQISPTTGCNTTNGSTAMDPILNAYPIYPVNPLTNIVMFAGGSAAAPMLDANASTINNYYIGNILEDTTTGQYRTIVSYNGTTQTATLDTPFTGWAAGDTYVIRQGIPMLAGTLTGGSSSSFILPGGSSTLDNFYTNQFIWIKSGPAAGDIRVIKTYVGSTLTGTVGPNFPAAIGAGNLFEILQFTKDNFSPLIYTGSTVSQSEMVCYEIELIDITIPNTTLLSQYGGLPAYLPYIYVEFTNLSAAGAGLKNIIYSNNPNSTKMLFRVPLLDISAPVSSYFLKLDSNNQLQTIKFKPNDNFRFGAYLPTGEPLKFAPDNFSPLPPNPLLQISTSFSIKRI